MHARTFAWLSSWLLVSACSSRTAAEDEQEGTSESDTTGETSGTDTSIDGDDCTCVESPDLICNYSRRPMALNDCEVPEPCGVVDLDDPNADVATCVLQLLIDQDQPSRFDYIAHVPGGWGDDTYLGTFFVLGPGEGIDLECVLPSYDCCAPPPPIVTPAFHGIREPAYFENCLGLTASLMAECIFNGLEMMDIVPECS